MPATASPEGGAGDGDGERVAGDGEGVAGDGDGDFSIMATVSRALDGGTAADSPCGSSSG